MNPNRRTLLIVGIAVLVILLYEYSGFFVIVGEATKYRSVTFSGKEIIYGGVISLDFNKMTSNNIWTQWQGGNIDTFNNFIINGGLISWYVGNVLKLDTSDFSISSLYPTWNNIKVSPNYCNLNFGGMKKEFLYLDQDSCPHYKTYTTSLRCCCNWGTPLCQGENLFDVVCEAVGSTNPGFPGPSGDCSTYTVLEADIGGSLQGPKNNNIIFTEDGWAWNQQYNGWDKGTPTQSKMIAIAQEMVCYVNGTYRNCNNGGNICSEEIPYQIYGTVSWEGDSGFNCLVTPISPISGYEDVRVSGIVSFETDVKVDLYRKNSDYTCSPIRIFSTARTVNDYDTSNDCENAIPPIVGYYRLIENCTKKTDLRADVKTATDFETFEGCFNLIKDKCPTPPNNYQSTYCKSANELCSWNVLNCAYQCSNCACVNAPNAKCGTSTNQTNVNQTIYVNQTYYFNETTNQTITVTTTVEKPASFMKRYGLAIFISVISGVVIFYFWRKNKK